MNAQFRVRGAKELIRALEKLDNNVRDDIKREFEKGAKKIEADAKRELRKGHGVKTGTLKRSITSQVDAGKDRITARIGTNLEYAPYVEFGHRGKTRKVTGRKTGRTARTRTRGGGFPGYKYLTNAYQKNLPGIVSGLRQVIRSLKW